MVLRLSQPQPTRAASSRTTPRSRRVGALAALAALLASISFPTAVLAQSSGDGRGAGGKGDAEKAKPGDGKADAKTPEKVGDKGEGEKPVADSTYDHVFAEKWFEKARPTFELHGYYRVRSELFAHFDLGRKDDPDTALWARPTSDDFVTTGGATNAVVLCGDDPLKPEPCSSFTQGGANTRLRVSPTLTISDNIRAFAEIDLFDNIVLGSTPEGYVNQPDKGGYAVRQRGGYTPIGAFAATQWAPSAGQNTLSDSIAVKRAWGEYVSPFGTFKFGRMPNQWGLGMVYNAGDGLDHDYGSTVDRIMFKTGIKAWDLYFAGMWDFADEGATGGPFYGCRRALSNNKDTETGVECDAASQAAGSYDLEGRKYDLAQSDDVWQVGLSVVRKRDPNLAKLDLARGDVVVNGGVYGVYRQQTLESFAALGSTPRDISETLVRRGYEAFIPDVWGELSWRKLQIGVEAALVYGSIENTEVTKGSNFDNPDVPGTAEDGWKMAQFGVTLESSYRAIEDRLRVDFGFGFATGDEDVEGIDGLGQGAVAGAPLGGLDQQLTKNRTYSTFRFHPDYQVDQILWRRIIGRVQSGYYFKPGVSYDFVRDGDGQRAGGGFNVIWSRAAEPVQTSGNAADLAVELDTSIFYQGLAGTFDAAGNPKTGFYGQLDYAVLFPLRGLGYLPLEEAALGSDASTVPAHMLRLYLGVLF